MTRKRRPYVAVETDVAKDESFAVLADICGYSRDEALGRIIRLWAWCSDRKLADAPDDCPGYAVPRGVVLRFLGPHGIEGIMGGGVDEFALGREFRGGLIYLRGTDVTVASMRARAAGASPGGKTRACEVLATSSRGPNGKFVGKTTFTQREGGETSTAPPPSTTVDPRSQIPLIPEVPPPRDPAVPSTSPAPGIPDRTAVREALRAELQAARIRAGAARKVEVRPLLAFDRGIDSDLTGRLALCVTFAALELLAGQARHAIAMAELEVTHGGKSFEWFTGAIFSGGNFSRLVGMTRDDATRERPPPTGRKAPRSIHVGRVEPLPSDQYTESGDQKI